MFWKKRNFVKKERGPELFKNCLSLHAIPEMLEDLKKFTSRLAPTATRAEIAQDMTEFQLPDKQLVIFLPLIEPLQARKISVCMSNSSAERLHLRKPLTTVDNELYISRSQRLPVFVRTHSMHENRVHVHYSLGDGDMQKAEAFLRHVVGAMTRRA